MFWEKIDRFVEEEHMLGPEDKVLTGLSGGADSICLALYLLRKKVSFAAVHVNHMLRGDEAMRDEEFVRAFCRDHNIPLRVEKKDVAREAKVRGMGLEEAGRAVRYECFHALARELGCTKIAVAHQADDQAETLLFHMARGSGIRGLKGIPSVNGMIIRPLLSVSRLEILEELAALGQDYVTDTSNLEDNYSRNYIRNKIMPLLSELNPQAVSHMQALAARLALTVDYLDLQTDRVCDRIIRREEGKIFLDSSDYEALHPCMKDEVLLKAAGEILGSRRDISSVHIAQIRKLMDKAPGKSISLPGGIRAGRTAEGLLLEQAGCRKDSCRKERLYELLPDLEEAEGDLYLEKDFGKMTFSLTGAEEITAAFLQSLKKDNEISPSGDCVRYFDYDKVRSQLILRNRQEGDYFIMDQAGRRKLLRRYFIDSRIPADRRDEIPLLADGSHIMWILGGRISEAYKVEKDTKRILRVQWKMGKSI